MLSEEIKQLSNHDFLAQAWDKQTADSIFALIHDTPRYEISFLDFCRNDCTACGGNWGGMLLTGIKHKWPQIWETIPEDLGLFGWSCLCIILEELGVHK